MMRFAPRIHPPQLLTSWFSGATWKVETNERAVFLTFDDGPVPDITPWVLDILEKEAVKATFFCVGANIEKHPTLYQQILSNGHSVGNHTFDHLQGLKTPNHEFYQNIEKAAELIDSNLFRPPHVLMKIAQYRFLVKSYRVIMWDIVSRDYIQAVTPENILKNIKNHVAQGSVISFHDSLKAQNNLKATLLPVIKMLKDKGFALQAIPYQKRNSLNLEPEITLSFQQKETA